MINSMVQQSIIEVGRSIRINAPVEHITFTEAKYSAITRSTDSLSVTVEGLILHRPHPQRSPRVDGTKVLEGVLIFENLSGYDLCVARLKPNWQELKGKDRFEPEKRVSHATNNSGSFSDFDIGAGYLIRDGDEFEVRNWIVSAGSLTFVPTRI